VTGPTYEGVAVGDHLPPATFPIERVDLVRYAGASRDFNPIHWSDRAARDAGLPDVIAHGMLTMAKSVNGVVAWAGDPAAVEEYGVRFVRPVIVPDGPETLVQVDAHVVEKLSGGRVRIELDVVAGGEAVLGRAEAILRLP
jgi:acyl dehydratase